jgi:predicted dehydrogenase
VTPSRVALIGYGLAGESFHAPLIAAVEGLELAAVVTRDAQRRARAADRHPQARLLGSADEVWAAPDLYDLVVVAAPNRAHAPLARAAIAAGLPVVVDKPLAATAVEARALVDEARARGVMLTVFQNRRWDGDFLTLRQLSEAGELGRVQRFESRFERWRPQIKSGWRESGDPEEGGGVLFDLGSHLIDQALQLFGPVSAVYGEVDARRPGARADDDAFVALRHESGVHSHLWMCAVAAHSGPRMRVLGDRAAYVKRGMDVQEDALRRGGGPLDPGWGEEPESSWGRVFAGEGEPPRPVPTARGAYERFYLGVARALAEGGPPPVDPEDAVRVLELLEAARG